MSSIDSSRMELRKLPPDSDSERTESDSEKTKPTDKNPSQQPHVANKGISPNYQFMSPNDCRKGLAAIRSFGDDIKPWTLLSNGEYAGDWALRYLYQVTQLNANKWEKRKAKVNTERRSQYKIKSKESKSKNATQAKKRRKQN